MEKNVIVVDEQGNEYEATYPKRAKGLVKNGRARFVDENKICLACPPDKMLEENEMSDVINKNQILDQIIALQNSLESIDNILFKLQCVSDSQSCSEQEEGSPIPLDCFPDVALEKVNVIRSIVLEREKTINKMLDFYMKLYRDDEAIRIDLIKSAFEKITDVINGADLASAEKYDALCMVTDKIAELVEKVVVTQ